MEDEYFHCESCNGELVAESDKLAAQEGGDGDDNARRRRREKLKDMLQKMEVFFRLYSVLLLCILFPYHYFQICYKNNNAFSILMTGSLYCFLFHIYMSN